MTPVYVPSGALVLVVDGRKARFLRNKGTPMHIEFATERVLEQENPPTREQGTDRPGRFFGADGFSRSAVEQTDWHQLAEDRFAARIADTLYHMAHTHTFESMVLVAPPRLLGTLRTKFHPEVSKRISEQVTKDLTAFSEHELAKMLS